MGTNCGKDFPPPDTSNVCTSDPIGTGDTRGYEIPHFCTVAGPAGNSRRREYCSRIGDDEWTFEDEGGGCTYDDCGEVKVVQTGCCDGCCGIRGKRAKCKRKAYRGNPAICCFRDKAWRGRAGDPDDQLCFESDARQRTCPPENRNITDTSCQDAVFDFCTGADLAQNDSSWLKRWAPFKGPIVDGALNCVYAVNRNLFIDPEVANVLNAIQPNPSAFKDAEGFAWSRTLLNQVFQKYADQGFRIGTLPGFPGYNSFQDDVLQPICTSVPGICQQGLFATCSNSTTDQLVRNPSEVPWCGCYLPQDQYQTYVDEFQVNRECTPICARQGNIPLVSANGIQPLLCNQSVCIIDDVTISLERTNVGGDINFAQFCGGCSAPISGVNEVAGGLDPVDGSPPGRTSSSCLCIMTNNTIIGASSQIEGINLSESCGQSQCFKQNPTPGDGQPDRLQIPCDSAENFNPFAEKKKEEEEEEEKESFMRWVIIGLVVLTIAVIILFMLYLAGIGTSTDKKIITRKSAPPRPVFPGDMKGSILNRDLTLTTVIPPLAPGGCIPAQSILTRDCGSSCPHPGLPMGISKGSILNRNLIS